MNADDARRNEIANAGQRLERFLQTLSPEDLAQPSACEGWTVADLVGHLIERGNPIPDQIERGLAGDLSPTPGAADSPPESEDQFRRDLDRRAVTLRQELGGNLLSEFARVNREFDRVLSLVAPDDWDKLCYHRLRPETVRAKADIRIAELAMHEWDIHWAFDRSATLAPDSLPGLISASGRAVRRAFRPDPSPPPGTLPLCTNRRGRRNGRRHPGPRRRNFRPGRPAGTRQPARRNLPLRRRHLRNDHFRPPEAERCPGPRPNNGRRRRNAGQRFHRRIRRRLTLRRPIRRRIPGPYTRGPVIPRPRHSRESGNPRHPY